MPPARRMWSLVSIGRFSRRFVSRWLADRYNAGDIGYEEIFLPTICAAAAGCRLAEFGRGAGTLGHQLIYRPGWSHECAQTLEALRDCQNRLWHPAKDRNCLVDYLDANTSGGALCEVVRGDHRFASGADGLPQPIEAGRVRQSRAVPGHRGTVWAPASSDAPVVRSAHDGRAAARASARAAEAIS